jgi:glycosyltransferase involved in cell wall biosynthesis
VIVGGAGRAAAKLKALAGRLGIADSVVWAGERSDMRAVYGSLDLLVSASRFSEGLPNVLGEALACGVPCVATDVGDAALVVDDPSCVVPPRAVDALAGAVLRRLDGDRSVPDLDLVASVTRRLGVEAMIDATEQALIDVVAAAKGARS